MAETCARCDARINHKHGQLCAACIADDMDHDDEIDPEGPAFECAGFNDGTGFYCPLWGSEECDWECPAGPAGGLSPPLNERME